MKTKSPKIHRTPLYRAKAAYRNMQIRCLNANGKSPSYSNVELKMSLEEWLDWSIPLYEDFIASHPGVTPSVGRKGDKGHCEIGNLEIVSAYSNRLQAARRQKPKYVIITCHHCGNEFEKQKRYYDSKKKHNTVGFFCSKSCVGKATGRGKS